MATLTHAEVVEALVARGVPWDRATQYADAFCDYQKAAENIRQFGPIVQHPRTGNPIPNPYLGIREGAQNLMRRMRGVDGAFLWAAGPAPARDQTGALAQGRQGAGTERGADAGT